MRQTFIQYGVGIDVGKDSLHVHFMGKTSEEELKIRGSKKFKNTPAGIRDLVIWIEKYRKDKTLVLRIYLEVTGVYHEEVLFHLESQGYWTGLLMGKRVKAYGKSLGEDSKNDLRDSYVLAHMALSRKERAWHPVSAHILEIRALMRHRKSLINTRVAYQNRLHALHHSVYPSQVVKDSLEASIALMNQQILQLEKEAKELLKKDEQLLEKINKIAESIKGLGIITMLEVISETNGFSEFRSINQLIKYAGYDIVENQSGKWTGKTRISKQGNARLRSAMYMPAMAVMRHQVDPFYTLYLRVLKRNPKVKKKALVAVQRKLLVIIYTLWKKDEAFEETYHSKDKNQDQQHNLNEGSSEQNPKLHGIAQHKLASNT